MLNKLFVVILFLVGNFFSIAQLHQITFQVDMTNELISAQGVHIAGDFQSIAGLGGNLSPSKNREINVVNGTNSPVTHCFNTCEECDPYLTTNFDTHWWNNTIFMSFFEKFL